MHVSTFLAKCGSMIDSLCTSLLSVPSPLAPPPIISQTLCPEQTIREWVGCVCSGGREGEGRGGGKRGRRRSGKRRSTEGEERRKTMRDG